MANAWNELTLNNMGDWPWRAKAVLLAVVLGLLVLLGWFRYLEPSVMQQDQLQQEVLQQQQQVIRLRRTLKKTLEVRLFPLAPQRDQSQVLTQLLSLFEAQQFQVMQFEPVSEEGQVRVSLEALGTLTSLLSLLQQWQSISTLVSFTRLTLTAIGQHKLRLQAQLIVHFAEPTLRAFKYSPQKRIRFPVNVTNPFIHKPSSSTQSQKKRIGQLEDYGHCWQLWQLANGQIEKQKLGGKCETVAQGP